MAKRKKEAAKLAKAIAASPEFQRLAGVRAEHERLEKAVAEARRSDPYRAYVHNLAKSGNPAARAELDRTRPDDPELLVYLSDLAKAAPTTPEGRAAQDLLDEKAREALERRDGQRGSR